MPMRRGPPTGTPGEPSTAGFAVVPAAAAVHERPGAVAERHGHAATVRQVGGGPVREEVTYVPPERSCDVRHVIIVSDDDARVD